MKKSFFIFVLWVLFVSLAHFAVAQPGFPETPTPPETESTTKSKRSRSSISISESENRIHLTAFFTKQNGKTKMLKEVIEDRLGKGNTSGNQTVWTTLPGFEGLEKFNVELSDGRCSLRYRKENFRATEAIEFLVEEIEIIIKE